jgi:hypothetical protein
MGYPKIFKGVAGIVAVGVVGSVLAGCGGGGTPSASASSSADGAKEAALWRQAAQCVREHGVPDFPDPVQNGDGDWDLAPGSIMPPQSVQDACKSIIDQIKALDGGGDKPPSAADVAALRKFAQCMRRQGIADWPDPNADGAFMLPSRLQGRGNVKLFDAQVKACKSFMPNGRMRIVSPS